jgi:hypothetical protein
LLCRTSVATGTIVDLCLQDCMVTLCMALQSMLQTLQVLSQHHPPLEG